MKSIPVAIIQKFQIKTVSFDYQLHLPGFDKEEPSYSTVSQHLDDLCLGLFHEFQELVCTKAPHPCTFLVYRTAQPNCLMSQQPTQK